MEKQEVSVWEIDLNTYSQPKKLEQVSPEYEEELETLLAMNIKLLKNGLLVIGRQLETSSGPLDLLCVEETGGIVVVELKKNRIPREAVVQAIDYASQISAMDENEFKEFVEKGVKKNEEGYPQFDDLYRFIQNWRSDFDDVSLNNTQRIVLAGCEITDQTEKMVSWLSARGVDINAYEFPFFKTGEKTLLVRRVIISPERLASGRAEVSRKHPHLTPEQLLEIAEKSGTKEIVEKLRKIKSIENMVTTEVTTQSNFRYDGVVKDKKGALHRPGLISIWPESETRGEVYIGVYWDEEHLAGYLHVTPKEVRQALDKFDIDDNDSNEHFLGITIASTEDAREFVAAIRTLSQ